MIYTSSNRLTCNAVTCLNDKYTIFIYGKYKNGKKFGNKTVLIGIVLNDTFKVQTMLGILWSVDWVWPNDVVL